MKLSLIFLAAICLLSAVVNGRSHGSRNQQQYYSGGLYRNQHTCVESQQFCFPFWACETAGGNMHCDPHCTNRGFQIGACMRDNHCCCYKPCEVVVRNY